jgi:protein-arginine kinase
MTGQRKNTSPLTRWSERAMSEMFAEMKIISRRSPRRINEIMLRTRRTHRREKRGPDITSAASVNIARSEFSRPSHLRSD